ncbi:hypothetical protein THIOKS11700003 [Thiocapsa sp. KS1]|nr:hypothetical protein THIOKS11700003 [Thiocapsa sp. KS1]
MILAILGVFILLSLFGLCFLFIDWVDRL